MLASNIIIMIPMIRRDLEREKHLAIREAIITIIVINIIVIVIIIIVIIIIIRRDLEREKHLAIREPIREYTRHCVQMKINIFRTLDKTHNKLIFPRK